MIRRDHAMNYRKFMENLIAYPLGSDDTKGMIGGRVAIK
jgi:hypothetical protein